MLLVYGPSEERMCSASKGSCMLVQLFKRVSRMAESVVETRLNAWGCGCAVFVVVMGCRLWACASSISDVQGVQECCY